MIKRIYLTAIIAFFCVLVGNASELEGKWKAEMKGPNGSSEMIFIFKVDGTSLTGTVTTPMGKQKIKNGKVTGNEFSFDLEMHGQAMTHTGVLKDDIITLTVEMPEGGPQGGPQGDSQNNDSNAPKGKGPGAMKLTRVE